MSVYSEEEDQDYIFIIDNNPELTAPTNQASLDYLLNNITSVEPLTGKFAPNTEFSLSDIPAGVSTEDDIFEGDDGSDTINAGTGNDIIYGRDGNDTLDGGAGNDRLEGGAGDDYLEDGYGNDQIFGGDDNDTINNIGGSDSFDGGAGTDTLITDLSSGFDERSFEIGFNTVAGTHGRLNSTVGQDTISSIENFTLRGNFNAVVTGGDEDNIFISDAGDDVLTGGGGDDTLSAWMGNDEVYAGAGNDTIINTGGEDLFDGGSGVDTLITDLSQSVKDKLGFSNWDFDIVFDLTAEDPHMRHYGVKPDGTDYAWDEVYSIENYKLIGDFDAYLTGDNEDNRLTADTGDDTLDGQGGNDTLSGGEGDDTLIGGNGTDTASYTSAKAAVTVSLELTTAQNTFGAGIDTLTTIENLTGSNFNDILTGTSSANEINGGDGDDVINGGKGHDTLDGGAGNDTLNGDDGTDTASYASATSGVVVSLELTAAQNTVGAGMDTLIEIASLEGSSFDDILTGNSGFNILDGGAGNDTMTGGAGNDTYFVDSTSDRVYETTTASNSNTTDSGGTDRIFSSVSLSLNEYNGVQFVENLLLQGANNINGMGNSLNNTVTGNSGNNTLDGGFGDDTLDGGSGDDTLTGGDGSDTFVFRGVFDHDVIKDFDEDIDALEFYASDGAAILASDLVESTNSDGDKVLSTSDGLSSVTLVGQSTPPSSLPAFDIRMTSSDNGTASFAIYANELVDPAGDGIGAFEFTLSHDPSDLLVDVDSIAAASGFFGVPNYNATTGVLELGGIKEPSFNDLSTPIVTFEATTLDTANPLTLTISNAFVDGVAQSDVVETFNFSSVSITATTVDRFGDDLVLPNDDVFAFEISSGDQFFVREGDGSDTNTVVEIVANPTSEFSALDFDLTDYAGLTDFTLSDALSNWTVQTNTTVADQVSFSGFSNSAEIPAGQETVLATFTTAIDPDFDISGIKLDGAAEPDVAVGEIPAASTNGNVTVFEVSSGTGAFVNAYKSIDAASEDAIGAYDALQALRLAVGLTKSDGTAEWHDYLAADINKDGRVGADDALDILKYAVGLTDGSSADWIFVDGDADWSGIDRRNTDYDEGVMLEDVLVDTSINMTGILVGDLDGSYVA
ncbi:calcium-binding protein [Lentibacter algarum]|uniref:calcium-binding protein n=2 Tax=Lentibacter algarum TaxID=576131 RepID=UPI00249133A4|nr:calcium-binding protein [Lentibacter algarum]